MIRPGRFSLVLALLSTFSSRAMALDKQASAHGGDVGGDEGHETEFNVSGAATLGVALANPTYGARPDNTGLALMRYALHVDVDLIGRKLSVPIDLNFFTDRKRKGGRVFLPTELDVITGLTTTHKLVIGTALELGARVEHDAPVDRGGFTQTYADVRARLLYSLGDVWPSLERDLVGGDISGWIGLGWFAINPTYAARPDNTGIALFRYMAHSELSVWKHRVAIGFDATMFTARDSDLVIRPTELDATYEMIGRLEPFELHLAYERDMPLDRGGLVQHFLYLLFVYEFDFRHDVRLPLEQRGGIPSP